MKDEMTIWHCQGCRDTEVGNPREICQPCLESHPEDWVRIEDYHRMVSLAYAAGQKPQHLYNEAQMVLAGFPSFQPRERATEQK